MSKPDPQILSLTGLYISQMTQVGGRNSEFHSDLVTSTGVPSADAEPKAGVGNSSGESGQCRRIGKYALFSTRNHWATDAI